MMYKQTNWITEHLEHVLEKGSAYRWQIARGQQRGKNGNDVSFTLSHLKNNGCNTSAMWNEDNYWRNFFHRKFKESRYSFSVHVLFCKHTPHAKWWVYIIAVLSGTRILWINHAFIHTGFELCKIKWVF